jgi:hypothetical protein
MKSIKEKFTLKVTDAGFTILAKDGTRLDFSAGEALMLLDVLKNEELELKKIAEESSPLPIRFNFFPGS